MGGQGLSQATVFWFSSHVIIIVRDDMHTIATIVPHIDYLEPFTVVTHCTLATIVPHIYYLEPFTVVTHPLLERANLKTFPVRAFLVAFPSCTSLSYLNKQEQSIAEGLIGARVARRFA